MFNLFKTKPSLRKDGVYVAKLERANSEGKDYRFIIVLAFNNHFRSFIQEEEGFPDIDKNIVRQMVEACKDYTEISQDCAEYEVRNGYLKMMFRDDDNPNLGWEYQGRIEKDHIIMDLVYHFNNQATLRPDSELKYGDVKFEFHQAQ